MSEMQFSEVDGRTTYLKPAKFKSGDVMVEGVFKKTFKSDNYDQNQHEFLSKTAGKVVVNGSKVLDGKLSDVPVGSYVRLIYRGMEKSLKGKFVGKEFHNFSVLIADNVNTDLVEKHEVEEKQTTNNPDESFLA